MVRESCGCLNVRNKSKRDIDNKPIKRTYRLYSTYSIKSIKSDISVACKKFGVNVDFKNNVIDDMKFEINDKTGNAFFIESKEGVIKYLYRVYGNKNLSIAEQYRRYV